MLEGRLRQCSPITWVMQVCEDRIKTPHFLVPIFDITQEQPKRKKTRKRKKNWIIFIFGDLSRKIFCLVWLVYIISYIFYFCLSIIRNIVSERRILLIKFGSKIRAKRYENRITQMQLAQKIGCSLQAIGNIERGQANPTLIMVYRIAKALGLSAQDLLP